MPVTQFQILFCEHTANANKASIIYILKQKQAKPKILTEKKIIHLYTAIHFSKHTNDKSKTKMSQ